ncbi:hypothetical protein BJX64DRAFT_193411 [Aspergillus heterothallicus]
MTSLRSNSTIMSSFGSVLARRGTEILLSARLQERAEQLESIPGLLGLALLFATWSAFSFALFWLQYTCTFVAATLAAVEASDGQQAYIRLELDGGQSPADNPLSGTERSPKPITSSLRATIRHLRAHGGTFRGFRMYLAWSGVSVVVSILIALPWANPSTSIIESLGTNVIGVALGRFVGNMLSATWLMAWVHLIIADKSPRTPYRRKLGLAHWPRIAPAAAVHSAVDCIVSMIPTYALGQWSKAIAEAGQYDRKALLDVFFKGILPGLVLVVLSLPARVVFTRVAASMLPEEDEPIVALDPVFGGKVGGRKGDGRQLGLWEAWTSFDWAARKRYAMVFVKVVGLELAMAFVAIVVLLVEMVVVLPAGTVTWGQ